MVAPCRLLRRTIQILAPGSVNSNILLAASALGAVLVVGGLFIYIRRKFRALQTLLVLLFTEVGELAGTFFMETADVVSDWWTGYRVLIGTVEARELKPAYAVFLCLGTLAYAISMTYRIRNAMAVKAHMAEFSKLLARDHSKRQLLASSKATHSAASAEERRTDDRYMKVRTYQWEVVAWLFWSFWC
jgi:hypothetical protein